MKIINESKKENLPVEFMTQFISKGWEEVGNLKSSLEGVKQTFKGSQKVENIIQGLMDAYLIAIGQMEGQLNNKIDMPENKELKETYYTGNIKSGIIFGIEADSDSEAEDKLYDWIESSLDNTGAELDDLSVDMDEVTKAHKLDLYKDMAKGEVTPEIPTNFNRFKDYCWKHAGYRVDKEDFNDYKKYLNTVELKDVELENDNEGLHESSTIDTNKSCNSKCCCSDDEWPEPDLSDTSDIDAARSALSSGQLNFSNDAFADQMQSVAYQPSMPMSKPTQAKSIVDINDSDWFVDFGEPDMSVPKLTDTDIYGNNK